MKKIGVQEGAHLCRREGSSCLEGGHYTTKEKHLCNQKIKKSRSTFCLTINKNCQDESCHTYEEDDSFIYVT